MPAYSNLTEALGALDAKLKTLEDLAEANSFLVSVMRDHEAELKAMSEDEARRVILLLAAEIYGPGGCKAAPGVMAILEQSFKPVQTAEIIAFPGVK